MRHVWHKQAIRDVREVGEGDIRPGAVVTVYGQPARVLSVRNSSVIDDCEIWVRVG